MINNGKISIKNKNNYFIRNSENHLGWNQIRKGNIVFFYGDNLHYDIIDSKIVTLTEPFVLTPENTSQFNYSLETSSTNNDYLFEGDLIKLVYSGIEYSTQINNIRRDGEKTLFSINYPICYNNKIAIDGSGFAIITKNKVSLKETYQSHSLYNTNYHIAQDFTKNLNIPLMETTNPLLATTATMYNRCVKLIDERLEHTRIDLPNILTQSIKPALTELKNSFEVEINPPLSYIPIIFGQIENSITKQQYEFSFSISEISNSRYLVYTETPLSENDVFNAFLLPPKTNYSALFAGFKDTRPIEKIQTKGVFTFHKEYVSDGNYIINLSAPFDFTIEKFVSKTRKGFCSATLQINEVLLEDINFIANPNLFSKHIQPIKIEKGQSISFVIENIDKAEDLNISIEYSIL